MIVALLLAAASPAPLAPLDWLVGHCWRGTLPNGDVDTHCFAAGADAVSDHHEVWRGTAKVYWGDTRYVARDGAIRFTYVDMTGGTMAGVVASDAQGLDFAPATYVGADGERLTVSTRWRRIGAAAYEVHDWSADAPAHDRITRYDRMD